MSISGNSKKSQSNAVSDSSSFGYDQSQTYLDANQAANQQALQGSYLDTMSQYQQNLPVYQQAYGSMIGQIAKGAPQGIVQPGGGGGGSAGKGGRTPDMRQLEQFVDGENPYLQSQVDQFGNDIDRQYGVMQQRLGGNAAAAGSRGSSRQGIAESGALGEYLNQFQQGVTNMRSNAYNQQQAAATNLAGFGTQQYASQNQLAAAQAQAAAQKYGASLQAQTAAEQNRLAGIELGMSGLQEMRDNIFNPFQIGSQVIGSPSVIGNSFGLDLSQSHSESRSTGQSGGFGIGWQNSGGAGGGGE